MPVSTTLNIRESGAISVIDIIGRITLGEGSNALHAAIRGLIAEGHLKIVLNLSQVTFMDSSGIGEIASGYVHVKHHRGKMKLCELTKRERQLLQVTRLYGLLDVYTSEHDALSSFA